MGKRKIKRHLTFKKRDGTQNSWLEFQGARSALLTTNVSWLGPMVGVVMIAGYVRKAWEEKLGMEIDTSGNAYI